MKAATIAEFYVEGNGVRLELEVGAADLPAFRNLLTDEVWERAGWQTNESFSERFEHFYTRELVVADKAGRPLSARISAVAGGNRVARDEVTGESLANTDEPVLRFTINYKYNGLGDLNDRVLPETLVFLSAFPLPGPNIGFVVYHEGVAVNDFRFLSRRQVLDLDWQDPWYSRFESRALVRNYSSAMSGFIYVEPFEVRKEIILRPKDLQRWIDLGLAGKDIGPAADQREILNTIAAFLRDKQPVVIDGETIEPELARINFLRRTLKSSQVIDPPEDLPLNPAIVGAIFVYPLEQPLPQKVTMTWDLFDEKVQKVSAATVDEAGPFPVYLEPDAAELVWQNFLKNPTLPGYTDPGPVPSPLALLLGGLGWVLALAAGLLLVSTARGVRKHSLQAAGLTALLALAAAAAWFWQDTQVGMTEERRNELVAAVLQNVYQAFDYRAEGDIYDALARVVDGDLRDRIYLETQQSLLLANQGGARAKVKDVELTSVTMEYDGGAEWEALAEWTIRASVGHWGHVHQRNNRYRARLKLGVVDDQWKLLDAEVLEEERLQ